MSQKAFFLLAAAFSLLAPVHAQRVSRSGLPQHLPGGAMLRGFPCAGAGVLAEDFEAAVKPAAPAGWQVRDYNDSPLYPDIAGLYTTGWQSIADFKDGATISMASPSWHADTSVRNNTWLISPPIVVGANTCLSWRAYAQDVYFPESYEVRVSKTPADTASFKRIYNVPGEVYALNYRSVSLSDSCKAGDTVYVAFRHTSRDKFILVLDDIRVSEVAKADMAIYAVKPSYITKEGDSTRLRITLKNEGRDTLKIDSTALILNVSIEKGSVKSGHALKTIKLAPNDTLSVWNSSYWVGPDTGAYHICVWISGITDGNAANDTSCTLGYVGFVSGTDPGAGRRLQAKTWPNPTDGLLHLVMAQAGAYSLADLAGRTHRQGDCPSEETTISLHELPAGVYFLRVTAINGQTTVLKVIKE